MTDTQSALLRAILSDPASDEARIAYAIWLQDDGDQPERAEFIRVQVELATLPVGTRFGCRNCTSPSVVNPSFTVEECGCQYKKKGVTLRQRERELLTLHSQKFAELPVGWLLNWGDDAQERPFGRFSRGFISRITCTSADWLAHVDALYWKPGQRIIPRGRTEACDTYDYSYPRPVPPGAQPIERVVLTEWSAGQWLIGTNSTDARWIDAEDRSKGFTDGRWPGIVFEAASCSRSQPIIGEFGVDGHVFL